MPERWSRRRLADVVTITHGYAFAGEHFVDHPTSSVLLTPGNFRFGGGYKDEKLKYYDGPVPQDYVLPPGSLVVTMTDLSKNMDTLGYPAWSPCLGEIAVLHNQRLGLVAALVDDVDLRFIYYVMCSRDYRNEILASSTGTTVHHTSPSRILDFVADLPPLEEQRGIAATLGALDDKIESNRRLVANALSLARAQVDRVAVGRPTVPYAKALEVNMGSAFKGGAFSPPGTGRPLLRIRDLKTFEPQIWTTEERKDETVIRPGDIVVGMDAEFRATLWLGDESVLNQRVCSFRGRNGVGRAFTLAALEPELAFQEQAKTGTTVIHLNKADIESFVVPELTVDEHRNLADDTEPLIKLAVARSVENRVLLATRETLLPELLMGHIRVPEAGEVVA